MPLPRLLILPAAAALLALAAPASPASADPPACACAEDFPLESPDLCYVAPGARVADFAYTAPSDFLQVVGFGAGGYCRHNAAFQWTNAADTLACAEFIGCLCDNPSPGAEVLCNGNDDDCDPATLDAAPEVCDNGIDDDCDGHTDQDDPDCAPPSICVNACPDDNDVCTENSCIGEAVLPPDVTSRLACDAFDTGGPLADPARHAACVASLSGAGFYCYVSDRRSCPGTASTCDAATGCPCD